MRPSWRTGTPTRRTPGYSVFRRLLSTPAGPALPVGYRVIVQQGLFRRTATLEPDWRTRVPTTPAEETAKQDYELSRLAWLDLVEAAPSGSVAHGLQLIAQPLYELVGEIGGRGMGKTFSDNKTLFYSDATPANVVAWAKYETVTIGTASYTSRFTKVAGMTVSEAGRAWLLWLCHCAETGHTKVDSYVLSMNQHYPWNELGITERAGIRAVAKLDSGVSAVVPPNPVSSSTLEDL